MTEHFILPKKQTYLLNHSVGCISRQALAANQRFIDAWSSQGSLAWSEWLDTLEDFRQSLAGLFNGPAHAFCPATNVSDALFKLIASIHVRDRNTIVYSELDFPTIGHVLSQVSRLGFQIKMIPSEHVIADPIAAYEAHIDATTAAAIISHTTFGDSHLLPYAEIHQICQRHGALSILDVAQSAGVIPIDLNEDPIDLLIGSSIKWLCGGPGAAYLYVDPKHINQLSPINVGWFSNQDVMSFDIQHFEYAKDSRRFLGGTPSILPFAMAAASIRALTSIGIAKIRAHNLKLQQLLLDQFSNFLNAPSDRPRGGTVTLNMPDAANIEKILHDAHIICDHRPNYGLRFSPHIYNTEDDIKQLCHALNTYLDKT